MTKIEASNVCVDLPIYGQSSRSLRHSIMSMFNPNKIMAQPSPAKTDTGAGGEITYGLNGSITIKAIEDFSIQLGDGDRIGLIGPNGSGKSTLLLTLAGVYEPSAGELHVEGIPTGLFSLDQGMDEDLSGRDNLALRGQFLGLTSEEIEVAIEDVEKFSELGEFIDLPIRTYSRGMRLRLAFGISTHRPSDILLIDELIGVGDTRFRVSAQERLENLIAHTGILIVANHSHEILKRWCNRGVFLYKGRMHYFGDLDEAFDAYKEAMQKLD